MPKDSILRCIRDRAMEAGIDVISVEAFKSVIDYKTIFNITYRNGENIMSTSVSVNESDLFSGNLSMIFKDTKDVDLWQPKLLKDEK